MRLLLLLAFFCFLLLLTLFCSYPGLGILPQTDSFRITSVWPPIDTKLHGGPVELHARIRYRLISMDRAMLSIGAERFWGTTQGCHDPNAHHHSEGGTRTLLKKGTGDVDVTFTWVGDVPSYSTVPRNVTTFVGMGMRLWPESLKPPSRFLGQSSFCYSVLPTSQDTSQPPAASPNADPTQASNLLVGPWGNQDPNTGGIPQLNVRRDGARLLVHAWGACHPTNCDWGEEEVELRNGIGMVVWEQGFKTTKMQLVAQPDGRLRVEYSSEYHDNSGRMDKGHTEFFAKQAVQKTDASSVESRAVLQQTGNPNPTPEFAGAWIEKSPASGPAMRLKFMPRGSQVEVYLSYAASWDSRPFGVATIHNDNATFTVREDCAERFRTPGYNYDNPGESVWSFRLASISTPPR